MFELEETKLNAPINLDVSLIPLVHKYLSGTSMEDCAVAFNLNVSEVSAFLDRREVKSFITNQLKNTGYVNKKKRIDLLARIVENKLELAEDNDLPLSNKDIIEVLKLLRDEENDLQKLSGAEEENSGKQTYINIINSLKAD